MLLNISHFRVFYVKTATPWKKSPPLSQQPFSKNRDPVKPPFFENLFGSSTHPPPPSRKGRGAQYYLPLNKSGVMVKWKCLKFLYSSNEMCRVDSQLKKLIILKYLMLETPCTFFSIFSWYFSFTHTEHSITYVFGY